MAEKRWYLVAIAVLLLVQVVQLGVIDTHVSRLERYVVPANRR